MSDLTIKKVVSGQPASLSPQAPKGKKTGAFDKILNKSIAELNKVQNKAENAVARKLNSGQLNQLNEVQKAIKETNAAINQAIRSQEKMALAYQKMLKKG